MPPQQTGPAGTTGTAGGSRRPCVVPAVGAQRDYWVAMTDDRAAPGAMAGASGPYVSALPAALAQASVDLPADLAADAADAAAALARFRGRVRARLGDTPPALAAVGAALVRVEAVASARLSGVTVVARQLALAELGQVTSENAAAVVAGVRAVETALRLDGRLDGRLDEDAVRALHRKLGGARPGEQARADPYRDRLVWTGGSSVSPRGAAYVGPKSELVGAAMRDLAAFLLRSDLPDVVHAAIAHAQLETVLPFADGNARTGRALVQAMLGGGGGGGRGGGGGGGAGPVVTAPVSTGLLADLGAWTAALDAFRAGDARPVVERFAGAVRFAVRSAAELVDRLTDQLDTAHRTLSTSASRPQAEAWRALPHLVAQPVLDAHHLADHLSISSTAARQAIAELADAGVLVEGTGLGHHRVWQHVGVLEVLDTYLADLRRA